jgi:hypothetical protein
MPNEEEKGERKPIVAPNREAAWRIPTLLRAPPTKEAASPPAGFEGGWRVNGFRVSSTAPRNLHPRKLRQGVEVRVAGAQHERMLQHERRDPHIDGGDGRA